MYRLILTFLLVSTLVRGETLDQLAERAKPGILGVAVCDLRTGITKGVNLDRPFAMASVFKAFIAAAVLDRVDSGQLTLDQKITLAPRDLCDGVGPIDNSGGGTFTLRRVLEAALIPSDNSAANALLRLVPPAEVTARLKAWGITGIRIDRDERTIARDTYGIPADFKPGHNASELRDGMSREVRHAAFEAALTDLRDTATPNGAVQFLADLKQGRLLTPNSTALLLGWMEKCSTGEERLKAGLPPKATLAHKTGSAAILEGIALATNDIGLVTLPNGETYAIAVFLANSPAPDQKRDKLIADCAGAAIH